MSCCAPRGRACRTLRVPSRRARRSGGGGPADARRRAGRPGSPQAQGNTLPVPRTGVKSETRHSVRSPERCEEECHERRASDRADTPTAARGRLSAVPAPGVPGTLCVLCVGSARSEQGAPAEKAPESPWRRPGFAAWVLGPGSLRGSCPGRAWEPRRVRVPRAGTGSWYADPGHARGPPPAQGAALVRRTWWCVVPGGASYLAATSGSRRGRSRTRRAARPGPDPARR